MTRRQIAGYSAVLLVLGTSWGLTVPLTKIAVSTGYLPFGLIFWQLVIGAALMAGVSLARGRGLPLDRPALTVCAVIALVGTVLPNAASYRAIAHIPAGVHSILMSLIPMAAFPMALMLGLERFGLRRLAGLAAGLGGVLLLVVPDASLPDPAMLAWIPLALVAPVLYAFEGNYVARWGTAGLDAIQVLFGASLIGAIVALPLAVASGQFISPFRVWAQAEWALVVASIIHVLVYAGYVWLVGRAGAVFAVQVSYVVTATGMLWAIAMLDETYSPYIWAALVLVLFGLFLVQPRRQDRLAPDPAIGETAR